MDNGYTPTTGQVRDAYVRAIRNAFVGSTSEHEAEFDRWIALFEAEAQVKALRAVADSKQSKMFDYAVYVGSEPRRLGVSATAWLHEHADRIAREAGIETEEASDD